MSTNSQCNDTRCYTVESWTVTANRLELSWGDGHNSCYAFPWLRDWCTCDECIDRQQIDTAAMLELPLDCKPRVVEVDSGGALRVIWEHDSHQSIYIAAWLRAHCLTPTAVSYGHSGIALANNLPVVNYRDIQHDENQLVLLETVRDFGFTLVRGVPCEPGEVARIAAHLGYVPGGWRYFSQPEEILVTPIRKFEEEQAGAIMDGSADEAMLEAVDAHYLRTLLVPHTDFSFTSWPTGLLIFHCLSPSSDGGGASILVDGFHVADRLRREDPEAFELLSTVRQPFCGHGNIKIDWHAEGRIISVDDNGNVTGIRFSMSSRLPLFISSDLIGPCYRATQAMLSLVLDPKCQIHLPLVAGDCLVLDNHRILHGRTGLDPVAGNTRWFRRFDVERDAVQTRMRQLARRLDREVAPLPAGAHG